MLLLIKPQAVRSPKPLQYEGSRASAGVNFVYNTGSGFKVALRSGVEQAGGVVAGEAVAHCLQQSLSKTRRLRCRVTYVVVQRGNDAPRVAMSDVDFNDDVLVQRRRTDGLRRVQQQLADGVYEIGQRGVVCEAEKEVKAIGPNLSGSGSITGNLRSKEERRSVSNSSSNKVCIGGRWRTGISSLQNLAAQTL